MYKKLCAVLLLAIAVVILFLTFPRAASETAVKEKVKEEQPIQLNTQETHVEESKSIEQIIREAAARHLIDAEKFLAVAKCESGLRPKVIGDDGSSVGLFQIHLPSHPEVTKELAEDPEWAAEWSAKKFKVAPRIWVCYRKLYEQGSPQ